MISLEVSLKHLAWSNQKFFTQFVDKPDEIFGLRAADGEWPVGQLLTHLAGSGQWYCYLLTGIDYTDLTPITNAKIVDDALQVIADLDAVLLANLDLPDELVTFEDGSGPVTAPRSLLLAQAVMHAAEHKGQIATIMKQHGHHIDLDELDVWAFIKEKQTSN